MSNLEVQERIILSDRIIFKNVDGLTIVGYFDHLPDYTGNRFIVIPPAYGETKKDYISLSYYLVSNGFNVVRYDNTFHLGESEGEILNADLTRIYDDLLATLQFVEQHFGQHEVGVVASSLTARIALKVAANDRRIVFLVNLVGVTSLEETLKAIYQEDVIGEYKSGKRWGTIDIFGHEVNDTFIENAIDFKFHDLESTIEDVRSIDSPIVFFVAAEDAWIRSEDVRRLVQVARHPETEMRVIPGAMHQLQENPRLAKLVISEIVVDCVRYLMGKRMTIAEIAQPDLHDIVAQNKAELQNLKRLSQVTKRGEKDFWCKYLSKFSIILRSPDYQEMMRSVEQLVGSPREGDQILDAGCGSGHFGVWLLQRILEEQDRGRNLPRMFRYIGLDFVSNALAQARLRHHDTVQSLLDEYGKRGLAQWQFDYVVSDLDDGLPFPNGYFHKVCCNLVISYLQHPLEAMGSLTRVLRIGGKVVVSSLKPYCDLSLVYRNFAELTRNEEELLEARSLLSSTGKIRQKESEGHYHFYSESELYDLMTQAGLLDVKVFRTLGNQANIAVGEKRD